jgi:hypothetical protein
MTPETRLVRVCKKVELIVWLIAFVGIMWASYLSSTYQATLPRYPDPVAGRIYPRNIHGVVVYQTRDQRDRIDRIEYSWIVMLVAMFALIAIRVNTFGRGTKP